MTNAERGTIARIHVSDGPLDAWPIAERIIRGWQSGAIFYPDENVVGVEAVYRRVTKRSLRKRAKAQLEVLAWLHTHGVDAEQLDMALEHFCEPYGVKYAWPVGTSSDAGGDRG
jgi:hypothetical protein